jgi:hypothetical protein
MKIIDILSESSINEAPVGTLGQIGRKVGAAALGALGAKNAAAGIRGKVDMGDRANQYYTAYRQYLGQTGKDEKTATYADVEKFFKKTGLPTTHIKGLSGLVDPKELDQAFTSTAKDYFAGKQASSKNPADPTSAAGAQIPGSTSTNTPIQSPSSTNITGQSATQPFSVPALVQVIPQMNKRDLNKIKTAVDAALQGKQVISKQPVSTQGMTQAQTKAVKQAAAVAPVNAPVTGRVEPTLGKVSKTAPKKAVAI